MRVLIALTLLTLPTLSHAAPPLACDSHSGDAHLSILGPVAQFWHTDARQTGSAKALQQSHEGFPSAWRISIETVQSIAVVDENQCDIGNSRYPLSFVLMTDDHILHGCCTVAE